MQIDFRLEPGDTAEPSAEAQRRPAEARAPVGVPRGTGGPRPAPADPALDERGREMERFDRAYQLLRRGRAAEALALVPSLEGPTAREPIFHAVRAWALAETGRLGEAEAELAEARLRSGRGSWEDREFLERISRTLVIIRKERRDGTGPLGTVAARKPKPSPSAWRARSSATRATSGPAPRVGGARPAAGTVEVRMSLHRGPDTAFHAAQTASPTAALADFRLRLEAMDLERLRRFDTLLSLGVARGVDHYEYQMRTVRRVLRDFRGRALLADEVGLGKTIEACLCLEEYLQRGLVRRALLLVPPGLTAQWRDELSGKFGREVTLIDGARARDDAVAWGRDGIVLASAALARNEPHASRIRATRFDMVIVDEAHRLKSRGTKLWQLVDGIRSRFLLLLTATPIENDVIEIYNVLSLLRPGLFPTPAEFRKAFVEPGRRTPKDPAKLRSLLREVMIRNTRAVAEARLPPRFATTLRATPSPEEAAFHRDLGDAVRLGIADGTVSRFAASEVLRAAGSRPRAATALLERHLGPALAERAQAIEGSSKDAVLADLLSKRPDDRVIVFAAHRETLDHIRLVAERAGRRPVVFHGSMSPAQKAEAVAAFARDRDVLVASESGGEGLNLHFSRTVVNYDLPWNPMRIEQRIGRVHRIGQAREVFVFNLVTQGTIEEEILRVLDEKIDMFELVVGEVEEVLGRLGDDEREFSELVLDIYAAASDATDLRARFDALAERMSAARAEHVRVKELEGAVFGRDLEA